RRPRRSSKKAITACRSLSDLTPQPAFQARRESAQRALRSSAPEPSTTTSVRRSGPPWAAREMAVGKRVSWNMVMREWRMGNGEWGLLPFTIHHSLFAIRPLQVALTLRDGAGQQGGELGLGAAEALNVRGADIDGDGDARAAVGADAEAAIGAAGEGQDGLGAAFAGQPQAVAGEREGDGAGDDAALRERYGQALADHATAGEGGAADEAGERVADAVGEVLEGGLERELGEAEREGAQHVAEASAFEGEVHEGLGQRIGEARAGLGDLGELRLQRARVGIDGDGEGGGEVVGHVNSNAM